MANIKVDKNAQVFLVLGMMAMLVFAGFAAFKPAAPAAPVEPVDADAIAQAVIGAIVLPTPNASLTSDKLDEIYAEMFKDDTAEGIAESLAIGELESKDFKKYLIEELMDSVPELQDMDYKDINEIVVRNTDVTLDEEDALVTIEFKVYVSNYGDEDEEEKARVSVDFEIEALDGENSYEDAEVAGFDGFELIKFYN